MTSKCSSLNTNNFVFTPQWRSSVQLMPEQGSRRKLTKKTNEKHDEQVQFVAYKQLCVESALEFLQRGRENEKADMKMRNIETENIELDARR